MQIYTLYSIQASMFQGIFCMIYLRRRKFFVWVYQPSLMLMRRYLASKLLLPREALKKNILDYLGIFFFKCWPSTEEPTHLPPFRKTLAPQKKLANFVNIIVGFLGDLRAFFWFGVLGIRKNSQAIPYIFVEGSPLGKLRAFLSQTVNTVKLFIASIHRPKWRWWLWRWRCKAADFIH